MLAQQNHYVHTIILGIDKNAMSRGIELNYFYIGMRDCTSTCQRQFSEILLKLCGVQLTERNPFSLGLMYFLIISQRFQDISLAGAAQLRS